MPSLESFEPTINAYASILIPRDDGSITITAPAPVGTVTVQGVVLTAAPGARVTGAAPTFNSLGATSAIAASLQDAINDPANPWLALGVHAKAFGAVVGLRRADPTVPIVPSATNITTAQATLGDFAAGSLSRLIGGCHLETFASQVIRWIRAAQVAKTYLNYSDAVPEGWIDPGWGGGGLDVTEDEALILFDELDAQGAFFLGAGNTFADLPIGPTFPAMSGTQQAVTDALLAGTLTIRGTSGLTSAQMRTLAQIPQVMTAIKASYWLNYPNHQVWGKNNLGVGPSGTGTGNPVFYDNPADETSNPNDRAVMTAFTYRKWPYPIRQGLDNRLKTAMLEVNVNAPAANAEFIALSAAWVAKTLINIG